jgi:hypothetical protein
MSVSDQNHVYDALRAGDFPVVTKAVTVVSGQTLVRGEVVGEITANGKVAASLGASDDGSETPTMIMAEACDASGGDAVGVAYVTGQFNEDALTIGAGLTAAGIEPGLRARGIFLKSPVSV